MNEDNKFKESLNKLFEDFEAPLPKDGWERLEASLNVAGKARLIRRNMYIGSAAAVSAILIGTILWFYTPQSATRPPTLTQNKQEIENIEKESTITKLQPSYQREKPIAAIKIQPAHKKINKQEQRSKATPLFVYEKNLKQSKVKEISKKLTGSSVANQNISPLTKVENKEKIDDTATLSQEEIDKLIAEFASSGSENIFYDDNNYENKDQQPLTLALNTRGAVSGAQRTSNSPIMLRSHTQDDLGTTLNNKLHENAFSLTSNQNNAYNTAKLHHAQPFSIGITVSKIVVDKVSVETGIIYSYLYSSTRNSSLKYSHKENQHFHNIGLPVNLNYSFINIGKINFYVSFGGMIEKDIYGEYQHISISEDVNGIAENKITDKIRLEKPQLSINGGFGVSYPIYGNISLYGKIGGAYYFNANNLEYKTIYSDKPLMVDLSAGIKFNL